MYDEEIVLEALKRGYSLSNIYKIFTKNEDKVQQALKKNKNSF